MKFRFRIEIASGGQIHTSIREMSEKEFNQMTRTLMNDAFVGGFAITKIKEIIDVTLKEVVVHGSK